MKLFASMMAVLAAAASLQAQPRLSEDRDLKPIDLTGWDCLNQLGGSAKTPDGVERNHQKNRSATDLAGLKIPQFDTAAFLRNVSGFDSETKGKHRKDLNPGQKQQLESLEKQVVSLTAYLVLAYAGPPETTNCGSVDMHDWHLEVFERPLEHPPGIGDPTPIICEITPRTQNTIFSDGVRIQKLAGFFRRPDLESEATGQPPQRVRITGFLTWDDDHNGAADVGTSIQSIGANRYHHPWRSSAWEIHPVIKIEPAEGAPPPVAVKAAPSQAASPSPAPSAVKPASTPVAPKASPQAATPKASPTATAKAAAASSRAPLPPEVTLVAPVTIKIPYGEAVLPRGMKLPLLSRDAQIARVNYLGQTVEVPLTATDLR
jgi:hypothetical protein